MGAIFDSPMHHINLNNTSQLKGVTRAFDINPEAMSELAATNSESRNDFNTIVSSANALKQELVDTAGLAVMYCSEQVVYDTSSPKYYDSQAKCIEWNLCLTRLRDRQKKLFALRDSIDTALASISKARLISEHISGYLSETASDFMRHEDDIKYVWYLKTR